MYEAVSIDNPAKISASFSPTKEKKFGEEKMSISKVTTKYMKLRLQSTQFRDAMSIPTFTVQEECTSMQLGETPKTAKSTNVKCRARENSLTVPFQPGGNAPQKILKNVKQEKVIMRLPPIHFNTKKKN